MPTSFAFYAIAFASAFGGVFTAGLAVIVFFRVFVGNLFARKVKVGEMCPVCKQRTLPVEADVMDFFSALSREQVATFTDELTDRQRSMFTALITRIGSDKPPKPGKDCH